jgi:DNA-binding MarR family transcriptional regulator
LVFGAENEFLHSKALSQGRFTVLMLLNRACSDPKTPAELADEAGVTRATITGLLDNLERDGLVVREMSPEDRRTILVRLTEQGQRCLDGLLPHYCRRVSAIMEPLTEAERITMVQLLQKVQQGLSPADLVAPTPAPAIASA